MLEAEEQEKFEMYSASICPVCQRRVPMRIYEEDGVIYLEKTCPEHGSLRMSIGGTLNSISGSSKTGTQPDTLAMD